jgi:hypothetical protein
MVISKDPWLSLLNAVLLVKQSLPILDVFGLTQPARMGLEHANFRMLSESTTTRLPQPVTKVNKQLLYLIYSWKESVCNFLPKDFYGNIISYKNILIKWAFPIDLNIKVKVKLIKHKSRFCKFLWSIMFIL